MDDIDFTLKLLRGYVHIYHNIKGNLQLSVREIENVKLRNNCNYFLRHIRL